MMAPETPEEALHCHLLDLKRRLGHGKFSKKEQAVGSVPAMLRFREKIGRNMESMKTSLGSRKGPNQLGGVVDSFGGALFCGTFSRQGDMFMAAAQDAIISLFDTDQFIYHQHHHQHQQASSPNVDLHAHPPPALKPKRLIHCRDIGWAIVGNAFSPDSKWVAYSSWSRFLHLSNTFGEHEEHEAFEISRTRSRHFCLFSLAFGGCGTMVAGGGNDGRVHITNLERKEVRSIDDAHYDDVNCISFLTQEGNILLSGSDDSLIKVWDLRCPDRPRGILVKHNHGITSIASKGDGVHVLSNSKDQTLKLWDLRIMGDCSQAAVDTHAVSNDWDYRFDINPQLSSSRRRPSSAAPRSNRRRDGDLSVLTFRGHTIARTLIRATFSPEGWTGGRFVTSGSSNGNIFTWDTMLSEAEAAQPIEVLKLHSDPVRDVAYHPHFPLLVSASWDRKLGLWTYRKEE